MANQTPFFSVVIPTKNRPVLLRDAILSVLWQDFTDFELIISDNHNDEQTQLVLQEFESVPQVRIIKPSGEMKMIDHWEFATSHSLGQYVILLADRKVLYQGALKKLKNNAQKYPNINAFSVGVQMYDEIDHKMGWCNAIGKTKQWKSSDLVSNFVNENLFSKKSYDIFFPKTLNGMYKNSFAKKVRDEFGHYFNTKGVTTPDYSSFFINTALNDEIVYIGEKIILTQGERSSNGRIFGAGKFQSYMDSLGYEDPYKHVPIKAPVIYNLLVIDYLTIQDVVTNNPTRGNLNWFNYFKVNYFEILTKRNQGLDDEGFKYFTDAWEEGLLNTPVALDMGTVKEAALNELKINNEAIKHDKIKRLSHHTRDFLAVRFSKKSIMNKVFPFVFRDVFHAAGFNKT